MTPKDWIRNRWLEYRWGYNYIGLATGLYQILLLTAIFLGIRASGVALLLAYIGPPLIVGTWIIGALHKRYQLKTDLIMGNQPTFAEIRRIIREELEREHGSRT